MKLVGSVFGIQIQLKEHILILSSIAVWCCRKTVVLDNSRAFKRSKLEPGMATAHVRIVEALLVHTEVNESFSKSNYCY